MDESPWLLTLLSRALVAFIIELDNAFEARVPHRTTNHGRSASASVADAPWLVSMVMDLSTRLSNRKRPAVV